MPGDVRGRYTQSDSATYRMPMGVLIGATWRIRVNLFGCGCDPAFCQINLTTYYYSTTLVAG